MTTPTTPSAEPATTARAARNIPTAPRGSYLVAIVLAIGICTALNLLTFGILWDAIFSSQAGISENATQILTGWGGGMLGIIGAVVGYSAGASSSNPGRNGQRIE